MTDVQTDGQVTTDPKGGDASAEFDQRLLNHVNAAVGSQLKRIVPKFLEEALAPHLTSLRESLQPKPEPKDKGGQSAVDPEISKQIEDLRNQLKKERETAARERRAAREEKAFAELRSELAGKVRPETVDTVAKLLFHADRRVVIGDDGSIAFRHGDAEYDLRGGLAEYLKSKDAAMFLPAPGYGQQPKKPGLKAPNRAPGDKPQGTEDPMSRTLRMLGKLEAKAGEKIL
ncbi:hypothetical protein BE20_24945 [Sorangium cellulosum]|uniref:Uncharacterized protein n=1 Tax=Sorangium cellulosum TaxID=56 RepID=A0A150S609_SORCE|nr:hypothetical protein BE20_24945 [Sorangium cellulosum]KYF89270.1 hypothetical protein BE18_22825 [Sorangium cellulosum]